ERSVIETKLEAHLDTFRWQDFDPNDFETFENKRKETLTLEQAIRDKEQTLSELRTNLEKEERNLEKYNQALTQLQLEEAEKETEIRNNTSHLKILRIETFKDEDVASIHQKRRLLLENIK